jgi:hypothetical protein
MLRLVTVILGLLLVESSQACRESRSGAKPPPPPQTAASETTGSGAASDTLAPEVAAMRRSLRDLVTAEESYFADSLRYTKSLRVLARNITPYAPAAGVTVTIESVVGESWRATATDRAAPGWTCGNYVGTGVSSYVPGQKESIPRCWKAQ